MQDHELFSFLPAPHQPRPQRRPLRQLISARRSNPGRRCPSGRNTLAHLCSAAQATIQCLGVEGRADRVARAAVRWFCAGRGPNDEHLRLPWRRMEGHEHAGALTGGAWHWCMQED